jgi:hypothetical protein
MGKKDEEILVHRNAEPKRCPKSVPTEKAHYVSGHLVSSFNQTAAERLCEILVEIELAYREPRTVNLLEVDKPIMQDLAFICEHPVDEVVIRFIKWLGTARIARVAETWPIF